MAEPQEKQQLSLALNEPDELFKASDLELDLQTESPPPTDGLASASTSFWTWLLNLLRR